MAAAEITETFVGGLAPHMQKTGQGLKMAVYTAPKVIQDDWVILEDFTVLVEAKCYLLTTGARAAEAHTIDTTTTNKLIFNSVTGSKTVSMVVWGY